MSITDITFTPSKLNTTINVDRGINTTTISGVVPHLKLNSSVTLVYRAKFEQNDEPAESVSRASVFWFAVGSEKIFGPVFTEETCATKQVVVKRLFNGEHTLLIAGGIAGCLVGVAGAIVFLYCVSKCPKYRHHFIHTEGPKEDPKVMAFPPYDYDYAELKSIASDDGEENFIRKLANTFFKLDDDQDANTAFQPSKKMMWKSAIFRGDVAHASQGLKNHFIDDYVNLLEFSLRMWVSLWRLVYYHYGLSHTK